MEDTRGIKNSHWIRETFLHFTRDGLNERQESDDVLVGIGSLGLRLSELMGTFELVRNSTVGRQETDDILLRLDTFGNTQFHGFKTIFVILRLVRDSTDGNREAYGVPLIAKVLGIG